MIGRGGTVLALGVTVGMLVFGFVLVLFGLKATGLAVAAGGLLILLVNYAMTALYRRGLRRDIENNNASDEAEQQDTRK